MSFKASRPRSNSLAHLILSLVLGSLTSGAAASAFTWGHSMVYVDDKRKKRTMGSRLAFKKTVPNEITVPVFLGTNIKLRMFGILSAILERF